MSTRLARVLATHLDPELGSRYWLERQRELGIDLRARIRGMGDLTMLGAFDLDVLARRPLEDFVPRSVRRDFRLILAETGGTTGNPKPTAYTPAEFHAAFVRPLLARLDRRLFNGGHWLWLGPNGPHIIGKAAQRIAQLTSRSDAFSVDFDPRWYRRLAPASLARARYLEHVIEQALRVLRLQDIRYLFATPMVLLELAAQMSPARRAAIRFVYLGGMAVEGEALAGLYEALPQATFLAGYGNTLFGVCHELAPGRDDIGPRRYFANDPRLHTRVVPLAGDDSARLAQDVAYGERGQVVMYRLDESLFLPGVFERDHAERIRDGGTADGLGDPRPPASDKLVIDNGIY